MKKVVCLLTSVAICMLATTSHASILTLGNGVAGGSWSAVVSYTGGPTVDTIEAFILADTGAGPFEAPGMDSFDNGWSDGSLVHPTYALASGPASVGFNGLLRFDGDIGQSLEVDVLVWSGGVLGTLVASVKGIYTDGNVVVLPISDPTGENYNRGNQVPEPTGLLIWFGLACGATIVGRRRRAKS